MPAGTGVCVVNTPPPRTTSTAAANGRPPPTSSRMRSRPRNPAWPSLVWKTSGSMSERPQGPDAADAEDDLLAQAVVLVAAVQAIGDGDAVGRVAGHLGVEQVQPDAPDVGPPHVGAHRIAGEVDGDLDAGVGQAERSGVELDDALLLPPVAVEALAEVALRVQQADADERHAEVRRRLEVVAGEDTQPAGVLGEGLADAELRREVGDGAQRRARARVEPRGGRQRRAQAAGHRAEVVDDAGVGGQLGQPSRARGAQHLGRVGDAGAPPRPQPPEQPGRLLIPRPVEVRRQLRQRSQRGGQGGQDLEPTDRAHGARSVRRRRVLTPRSVRRSVPDPRQNRHGMEGWRR